MASRTTATVSPGGIARPPTHDSARAVALVDVAEQVGSAEERNSEAAHGLAALRRGAAHCASAWEAAFYHEGLAAITASMVSGAMLIWMFDSAHWYFGWSVLAWNIAVFVEFAILAKHPVTPKVFEELEHLEGAVHAAVANEKRNAGVFVSTAISMVATVVLMGLFLFDGDLDARGAVPGRNTPGTRLAVFLCYCGLVPGNIATLFKPPMMLPALDGIVAAAKGVADAAVAGAPLHEVERDLLRLRRVLTLLRGTGIGSVFGLLSIPTLIVPNVVAAVSEPSPPALFVLQSFMSIIGFYSQPAQAAQLHTQLARIPEALSARAFEANATRGAAAAWRKQAKHSKADTADATHGDSASASGAGTGSGATPHGDGTTNSALAEAVAQVARHQATFAQQQAEANERLGRDLFLLRLDRLKLGWYVLGLPVSTALLTRLKAVFVPILVAIVRQHVDLGF